MYFCLEYKSLRRFLQIFNPTIHWADLLSGDSSSSPQSIHTSLGGAGDDVVGELLGLVGLAHLGEAGEHVH